MPNNEPKTFDGEDITEYRTFIISFERLIEKYCNNDEDKYYYLLKYTEKEANQLVTSCYNENSTDAFTSAKKCLEEKYGNQHRLAQIYIDKILDWNTIKSEDAKELSKFASYLTTCQNMMHKMSSLNQLNSWRDLKEIMMKLPYDLRRQFRNLAHREMEKNNEVKFETLVKFLNEHVKLLNMPMLGDISDNKPKIETKKILIISLFFS